MICNAKTANHFFYLFFKYLFQIFGITKKSPYICTNNNNKNIKKQYIMQILKDTISTVSNLIAKVKKVAKTATAENKVLWKEFLKECRAFIRIEKKRLAQKWNALRFASESAAQLHDLLSSKCSQSRAVAKELLFSNWEGYLLWIEKTFRNKDYSDKAYMGGSSWTGKFFEAERLLNCKEIKKLASLYKKAYLPNAKLSIKTCYGGYLVNYKCKSDKAAAEQLADFIEQFSYNFSNSMVDYFNYGMSCDACYNGK